MFDAWEPSLNMNGLLETGEQVLGKKFRLIIYQCIGRTPRYVVLHLAFCCGVILICYASVFLGDVEL